MKIVFDESFLHTLASQLGLRVAFVAKEFSRGIYEDVKRRTPVKSGHAQSNWNVSIGRKDTSVHEGVSDNDNSGVFERIDGRLPVYIMNSVPYILRLEDGYSKQAPSGMARAAESEAHASLGQIVQKAQQIPLA